MTRASHTKTRFQNASRSTRYKTPVWRIQAYQKLGKVKSIGKFMVMLISEVS